MHLISDFKSRARHRRFVVCSISGLGVIALVSSCLFGSCNVGFPRLHRLVVFIDYLASDQSSFFGAIQPFVECIQVELSARVGCGDILGCGYGFLFRFLNCAYDLAVFVWEFRVGSCDCFSSSHYV